MCYEGSTAYLQGGMERNLKDCTWIEDSMFEGTFLMPEAGKLYMNITKNRQIPLHANLENTLL